MKAEGVLMEVGVLLKEEGWGKGELKDTKGKRCVLGVINKVVSIEDEFGVEYPSWLLKDGILRKKCQLSLAASRLLLKRIGRYEMGLRPLEVENMVTAWNDSLEKEQEVIDVCLGKK